jgi:hypothetical protein
MQRRVREWPSYKHVEIQITRDSFCGWAKPKIEEFLKQNPSRIPSVDRINPKGHYSIGNIRIMDLYENTLRNFIRISFEKTGIDSLVNHLIDLCQSENINPSVIASTLMEATKQSPQLSRD